MKISSKNLQNCSGLRHLPVQSIGLVPITQEDNEQNSYLIRKHSFIFLICVNILLNISINWCYVENFI